MRVLKILAVLFIGLAISGCACRSINPNDPGGEGSTNITDPTESPLKDINFAFDSSALDSTAKGILGENAKWLSANSGAKVQIEGHCDERGTNEYNMALGSRRAKSAFDFLRSLGIDASRMTTVSYGEETPVDSRHNEEAWAKNRRDHFNVSK